jgi:hypothetical protein
LFDEKRLIKIQPKENNKLCHLNTIQQENCIQDYTHQIKCYIEIWLDIIFNEHLRSPQQIRVTALRTIYPYYTEAFKDILHNFLIKIHIYR